MKPDPFLLLLVEDNEDHAELVMRGLAEHAQASRVVHVTDGEVALDYLGRRGRFATPESSPRPNLVLLDLRLPKVDGLQVLKSIKEHPDMQDIAVVVLTTSEATRDINQAYAYRANSYVVKPVGYAEFRAMISALAAYWLAWHAGARRDNTHHD
ncbi:MAG: response regulator [Chloroflexi bacterium]|nr:response regulator [Chloroflexota bacterium]